jgi:ATP-dependent helicase/nuclease subunit B
LRGPRPRSGSAGLLHALQTFKRERDNLHQRDPRHRLPESEIDAAIAFAERFGKAIVPLEAAGGARKPFSEFAALHGDLLRTLSANVDGDVAAFAGRDGAMLESLFADIATANASSLTLTLRDYPDAFASMIGGRIVRRPGAPGARVRIFGPLEARLQQADRVVLGGLAEGIWPPQAASDPWLSRPMRKELGLDLPERRIGLSAHDFAQALGAREIVLTRPAKREGSPTVASRFLQRLAALAGEKQWHEARARGDVYLQWARTLDQPAAAARPCKTPMPKPPIAARPNRFSVTEVEDWVRDPYSIYAKRILRIAPLDPIDTPPGARDRGSVIHGALQDFTEATAKEFPADAVALLLELGRKCFARLDDYPEARAFWWPRFQRIARWLGDFELGRRPAIAALHPEVKGHVDIPLGERTLRLQCRADRVERLTNGRYAILDYKTGQVPSDKEVKIGFSPQLTLEGAILRHGSFEGIADNAPSIEELVYVRLKGTNPPGESRRVKFEDSDPDAEADKAFTRFTEFARRFESEDYPYAPLVLSKWRKRYGDYDHLSRVKEWSATGGEIEEIP